jgi:hypothetical protein
MTFGGGKGPVVVVGDEGRPEYERRRQRARVAVWERSVPGPAFAQAPAKEEEEEGGDHEPRDCEANLAGVLGVRKHRTRDLDMRVRIEICAEDKASHHDDHNRVDHARVAEKPACGRHLSPTSVPGPKILPAAPGGKPNLESN